MGQINYSLCIICQAKPKDPPISSPSESSLGKLLTYAKDRSKYGDSEYVDLAKRLESLSSTGLSAREASYHRSCYKVLVNQAMLERAKERYAKAMEKGQAGAAVVKKRGRPPSTGESSSPVDTAPVKRSCRSENAPFNKDLCIVCQAVKLEFPNEV